MAELTDYDRFLVKDYGGFPITDYPLPVQYAPWTRIITYPGIGTQVEVGEAAATPNFLLVPLDNSPNQSFETSLFVDGKSLRVALSFRYNEMAAYWVMKIADVEADRVLLDSIPLVTGQYPAANLLAQYAYLRIGSAYVIPVGGPELDFPSDTNLGTSFFLVWGDTP